MPPRTRSPRETGRTLTLCASAVLMGLLLEGAPVRAQLPGENIVSFRAAGIDVTLRFRQDRLRQLESQMRPLLTEALERYSQLFGGPPRGTDGQPLAHLMVHVQSDPLGGGAADVGTLHLLIGRQPTFGFYDWRMTLLHEAFHLWSAESFRFAGAAEEWFNEGAAEFYALQTAARIGMNDDVTTLRNAATMAGHYASASGVGRLSLTEAGQQKKDQYFLVNAGGFAAVLQLDYAIRSQTAGAKSLDDVLRWLYVNYDRTARLYTTADLARGIMEQTRYDAAELFAKSIMGRLPLSLGGTQGVNLGELSMSLQAARAGFRDAPRPNAVLLASLGLAGAK